MHVILVAGAPDKPGIDYNLKNFKVLLTPKFFYDEACYGKQEDGEADTKAGISSKLMDKGSIIIQREEIRNEVTHILDDPFYKSSKVLKML